MCFNIHLLIVVENRFSLWSCTSEGGDPSHNFSSQSFFHKQIDVKSILYIFMAEWLESLAINQKVFRSIHLFRGRSYAEWMSVLVNCYLPSNQKHQHFPPHYSISIQSLVSFQYRVQQYYTWYQYQTKNVGIVTTNVPSKKNLH